jgi:hypothetical protein
VILELVRVGFLSSAKEGAAVLPALGPPGSRKEPVVAALDNPESGLPFSENILYLYVMDIYSVILIF